MTYAGNRVFNFNNFLGVLLILLGSGYFITVPNFDPAILIAFAGTIPFAFLIIALMAFYFEITIDELIIKNYMIPFFNIRYKLNEITEMQFVNAKSPAKAKVKIVQEYKQTLGIGYSAASLGIKDWKLFIDELIAKKISIKIEANSLKSSIGISEE